jgi:hypothetical protein
MKLSTGSVLVENFIHNYIALMMETARTSETLVNFYQTTRRNNREDSNLRCRVCLLQMANAVFVKSASGLVLRSKR